MRNWQGFDWSEVPHQRGEKLGEGYVFTYAYAGQFHRGAPTHVVTVERGRGEVLERQVPLGRLDEGVTFHPLDSQEGKEYFAFIRECEKAQALGKGLEEVSD